jgi:hypothetical protein
MLLWIEAEGAGEGEGMSVDWGGRRRNRLEGELTLIGEIGICHISKF